ncbi:zinc-binding alcohol dehydrogenase family protein [Psychrobacillus lasiicapitis]|uniref:Zinc-binding alcohol dehydrogenase family protein n=1 Tax=Psychrobacillus lasiicapitis TaxID=1636719 RepID=A0A544TA35_9BACI|nr:zinc-binding alcohol dehydrogenase family protein [Psychrobacillus lasiicapitis]TQR14322.1 zinc-binding alcohol dehydrogenase family protein [Psychrobacillus lasiicapitis]GGA32299.1 alcohol dehydrogenase [Psychrobacillus lasiicapitis]
MKAITCTEPGKMDEITLDKPENLANGEVLVAIKRVGICGTDIHAFGGNQPFFSYPRVLGHELSGVVEAISNNVENVQVGDTVTIIPYLHCGKCLACTIGKTNCCTEMQVLGVHVDGGMAEYLKVPASHVFAVNELSLDDAAMVEPLSIGAHAVRRAAIKEGETVLIIGAGPIGLGAARFAKLQGAKTIMMDISEERLQFSKEWADCDLTVTASENAIDQLKEVNNGPLPSIVMDATGNKQSMTNAFNYVNHGGKLVYVGLVKDTITFFDPDFHAKELTLLGSRNATKEDFEYVINCLQKGQVKSSYVTNKITFDEVNAYFQAGNFRTNKTLITVTES